MITYSCKTWLCPYASSVLEQWSVLRLNDRRLLHPVDVYVDSGCPVSTQGLDHSPCRCVVSTGQWLPCVSVSTQGLDHSPCRCVVSTGQWLPCVSVSTQGLDHVFCLTQALDLPKAGCSVSVLVFITTGCEPVCACLPSVWNKSTGYSRLQVGFWPWTC